VDEPLDATLTESFAGAAITESEQPRTKRRLKSPIAASDLWETDMLYWALVFAIIALVAGVLGFGGVASAAASIARILFFIFIVIFLVTLVAALL
jgi:uncharacterized membrane protein YtjA (UPF0391 family)